MHYIFRHTLLIATVTMSGGLRPLSELNPATFIEVPLPSKESEQSYISVLRKSLLSLSIICFYWI
jgi:hypothetical protein